jgi:hypothetical protein
MRFKLSVAWLLASFAAQAALKTTWDVGDYVQEGLVMHYDGIRNVGAELPHDPAAKQWIDLSPTGGYATNRACVHGWTGSWTGKSYLASGGDCMQTANEVELGSQFTVQIACELDVTSDDRTHPAIFGIGSDNFAIRMDRSFLGQQQLTNVHWKVSKVFTGAAHVLDFKWHDGLYINAGANDQYLLFTNGANWVGCDKVYGTSSPREVVELPAASYFIGGNPFDAGGRKYCTIGHYYSVRAYSRMLTNEELAYNRDIDEVRFHGAEPTWSNSVYVVSASAEASGAETGAYRLIGEYTFTAPEKVATGDKKLYVSGSVVETWNAAEKKWENPVYLSGSSRKLAVSESDAARRLTWKWKLMNHLRILVR